MMRSYGFQAMPTPLTGPLSALAVSALLLMAVFAVGLTPAWADTDTDRWRAYASNSGQTVDHRPWTGILSEIVKTDSADGINRVDYAAVSPSQRQTLSAYLEALQALDPAALDRDQQMAYWINLYNALTVDLILEHYPVESIRDLGDSWFSRGPWDDDIARVKGQSLTLNDIEHRILRPIWKDPRIHYAVNCASLGCPDLKDSAWQAESLEQDLDRAASRYINHPRGARLQDGDLQLSSIYKWYAEDFGEGREDLIRHLQRYANPELRDALRQFDGDVDYDYDWSLNELPSSP